MIDRGTLDCPVDAECASCPSRTGLEVYEADTPVGILCMTLCEVCADNHEMPNYGWGQAARMVLEHCGHRGVDADYDARQREAEDEW